MLRRRFFIATSWQDNPISYHFRALAAELAARGHGVVLLVDGRKCEVEDPAGNPAVRTWPSPRPVGLRDAAFLHRLIREHRPDCLVANFGSVNVMTQVGALAGVPCRVAWYHTVTSAIDLDGRLPPWKRGLLRARKRLVYRSATHVVAVSRATCEDAQDVFAIPDRKCRFFYNSLADPRDRLAAGTSAADRPRSLVCVGWVYPVKGQDVLIRAAARLRPSMPDLTVDFLGGGPSTGAYQELAGRLGVGDICRFRGPVHHDEVLRGMASAAVTVVPSRTDSFPMVCVESLAVGTPLVASRVGGIPEAVRESIDGFLVPPEDDEALAETLGVLLGDAGLRAEMGARARERFLARFEQKKNVADQADWLEQIARPGGEPGAGREAPGPGCVSTHR
jgi:glycosyltransferase involved in cell wall biosynthesis